jgi:hypothetical protein
MERDLSRSNKWNPIVTAPSDIDLELCVYDNMGTSVQVIQQYYGKHATPRKLATQLVSMVAHTESNLYAAAPRKLNSLVDHRVK